MEITEKHGSSNQNCLTVLTKLITQTKDIPAIESEVTSQLIVLTVLEPILISEITK